MIELSPYNLSWILTFFFIIGLIILFYLKTKITFKIVIITIVASYTAANAIIACIYGLIYSAFYREIYSELSMETFYSYAGIGGIVTLCVTVYLLVTLSIWIIKYEK